MKVQPERPTTVRCSVYEFAIEFSTEETLRRNRQEGHLNRVGCTYFAEQRITIDASLSPVHQRVTLLHELLHLLWYAYQADPADMAKLEEPEESQISHLDHGLLGLLRDNPDIVAWLTAP